MQLPEFLMEHAAVAWAFMKAIGVFGTSLLLFSWLRARLWKRLLPWSNHGSNLWGHELLRAAELPARLIVFVCAITTTLVLVEEMKPFQAFIRPALRSIGVLLTIWLLDRVLNLFFRHQPFFPKLNLSARTLLLTVARIVGISLGTLVFLDTLGIPITPLLASFSLGTVGVSLALKETLENFFSGIYLLADQPLRVGDFVRIEESGIEGQVRKIGWRSTQIALLSNNVVVLANSRLSSAQVVNYDLYQSEMSVYIPLTVSFDNDLETLESLLLETGKETLERCPSASPAFEPRVRFLEIGESIVKVTVILRARSFQDHFLVRHDFLKRIHRAFKREGILPAVPKRKLEWNTTVSPGLDFQMPKGGSA
jgi:small-conductance mechanosensitive channel